MKGRIIQWMALFLAVVVALAAFLYPSLAQAFLANPVFNGMIIGVLLVGIAVNFRQVLVLDPELAWVAEKRAGDQPGKVTPPRLLAPLARMLGEREGRLRLSAMAARSVLDGIRMRLDEHRDVSRYLVGLLIFLGLLGTFWGLLGTVSAAGEVIAGLQVGGADVGGVFEQLKQNLQGPLAGMGTAFSSSLFGLGGALVLGFFDLQAGHAENRFFQRLEDWMSELTHLPSGIGIEGETSVPAYTEALLEKTADSLERLERVISRGEEERGAVRGELAELGRSLTTLADQVRSDQQLTQGLARQQQELQQVIGRFAEAVEQSRADESALRDALKGLEGVLQRSGENHQAAQRELVDELRQELRLLTKTLARNDH